MSKTSGIKVQGKIKDAKETTDAVDKENLEEKNQLLTEITALKNLIAQTENSFNIMTFESICKTEIRKVREASKGHFDELVDVEAVVQNELHAYAGFCCKKMGEEFIFAFQSFEKCLCGTGNWIQMFKVDEHWHLGKWVMPLSLDVNAVIAKYSIDSAASMKLFLRECKHLIDCYNRRKKEFIELKAFLEGLERQGCSVETNYGYTRIIVRLVKSRCASPEEARNILVYLFYKAGEARPWKLQIDCDDEDKLPDDEIKDLKALFKSVRERDLKDAVEKALTADGSPFIWEEAPEDNSMIHEDAEEEINFLKILEKNSKPSKKQRKVAVEVDENENEVSEDDDRREDDLSIDAADRSTEDDGSQVDVPKSSGKIRGNRAEKSPRKKSPRALPKAKAKPKKKIEKSQSKTSQATVKQKSPLTDRNDNLSNIADAPKDDLGGKSLKNDNATKSIVPDMFRPKSGQSKSVSKENKTPETKLRNHSERINKIGGRGRKSSVKANSTRKSIGKSSHGQLTCSTPIAGAAVHLNTVAEGNISAIDRENTVIAKGIAGTKGKENSVASDHSEESDSSESNCEDVTKVEDSHRELLKDLQAIKYKATVTKKAVKRKPKSPARGRNKISRK